MGDAELAGKVQEANGRVFVGFKDPEAIAGVEEFGVPIASNAAIASGKELLRSQGGEIELEFGNMPHVVARIPSSLVALLRKDSHIEYVEPIFPGTFASQDVPWNVSRVGAPSAWATSNGAGAKLLIMDSGIDNTHPDLAPAVVHTCLPYPNDGVDTYGHGTFVAGLAAEVDNGIQLVGAAPGVALWSSRVGATAPDPGAAACSALFARTNGVNVINMSLSMTPYTALTDELNAAYDAGIVLVAAAGNTHGGSVTYPANLGTVIAVSATDTNDIFASFSAKGPEVELAGPGTRYTDAVGITSTCLGGLTCAFIGGELAQGTSFPAPLVSAAAAIMKAANPSWSPWDIRWRLIASATDLGPTGRDIEYGFGMLNIPGALVAPPPPSPPSVTISGPSLVKPSANCLWDANASGTGPFTYYWTKDGGYIGNSSSVTTSFAASGTLSVEIWDIVGQSASAFKSITVSSSAPTCVF